MTYAIEKIPRKREMIGRTSFHIRVSGIFDISFLRARIPFQRLTCSFCKNTLQPLPRSSRIDVLSFHISRSTFGQHNFHGISELHKRQTRGRFYIVTLAWNSFFRKEGGLDMDPSNRISKMDLLCPWHVFWDPTFERICSYRFGKCANSFQVSCSTTK